MYLSYDENLSLNFEQAPKCMEVNTIEAIKTPWCSLALFKYELLVVIMMMMMMHIGPPKVII